MKKLLRKFLAINLIFALILISFPMSAFAGVNNGRGFEEDDDDNGFNYSYVLFKNSNRTASITYNYDGISPVVVTSSPGVLVMIPNDKVVTVTVQPKGNTPFGTSVKYRTTEQNSQVIAPDPFVFTAGDDDDYDGIITEVSSWKEDVSDEAGLESVFPVTDPEFDSDSYTYEILVKSLSNKPDLNPVPVDPNATVSEVIINNSQTKVTVTAEDGESTKTYTFNFVEREKPVITILGDNPLVVTDTINLPYVDAGAKATDADSDEISLTGVGTVDLSNEGTYTVDYNYTDDVLVYDGNSQVYLLADTATRTIEVNEYVYVVSVEILDAITVYYGSNPVTLPATVSVVLDNGDVIVVTVTFDSGDPVYDGTQGSTFAGTLNLPEGVDNPEELMAEQEVIVKDYIIVEVETLETIEVYYGDTVITLVTQVEVTLDDDSKITLDVTFDAGTPVFDATEDSVFIGTLSLIDGVTNPNNLVAEQNVEVLDIEITALSVQPLIEVFENTPLANLGLAQTVVATLNYGGPVTLDINLDDGNPIYNEQDNTIFNGTLVLPEGITNPLNLQSTQNVNIVDLIIVDVEILEAVQVAEGTMSSYVLPLQVLVTLNDQSTMLVDVDFGTPFALTNDINLLGDLINLPEWLGNPNNIKASKDITVEKTIIVDSPEAVLESDGVVLEIGYNKSYNDGSAQLYFNILPELPEEFDVTWEIVSGSGLITLSPTGFVEGLSQGIATVKITVVLDDETILVDTVPVEVVFFATPPPTPTPTETPNITLDRNEVELEVGTEALEEFFDYDFTESITGSSDFRATWAIADSEIATVDENGLVTALKEGETTVTVTHTASGDTATARIIVFLVGDEITPLGAIEFFDPYIYGYPDQSFGPQNAVTRAEVAAMFARILKLDLDLSEEQAYSDVEKGSWYFGYVQAMVKANIFVGDTSGTFRPNEAISRGEIASVFSKYWRYLDIDVSSAPTNTYNDVSRHWANNYIYQVHNAGIIVGFEDGTYKPNDSTLREQIVGMINTLIERPEYLAESTKFTDITKAHWAYGNIEAATQFYMVEPELPVDEK